MAPFLAPPSTPRHLSWAAWAVCSDASFRNRAQIELSKQCGCFSCCRIFPASEVTDYVSPEEPTAICPYCHIDSVIGDASGYPVTEEFMKEMNKRWF